MKYGLGRAGDDIRLIGGAVGGVRASQMGWLDLEALARRLVGKLGFNRHRSEAQKTERNQKGSFHRHRFTN